MLQIKYCPKNYITTNTISILNFKEELQYAAGKQELIGTYVIVFVAIVFSMPTALFLAIAESYDKTELIGLFYSVPAICSLLAVILSGWTKKFIVKDLRLCCLSGIRNDWIHYWPRC